MFGKRCGGKEGYDETKNIISTFRSQTYTIQHPCTFNIYYMHIHIRVKQSIY